MFKNMYNKQIKNIEIKYIIYKNCNGAFSHDVTAAILVFQNNETAAMYNTIQYNVLYFERVDIHD